MTWAVRMELEIEVGSPSLELWVPISASVKVEMFFSSLFAICTSRTKILRNFFFSHKLQIATRCALDVSEDVKDPLFKQHWRTSR